jgi:hypothetical protein
VPRLAPRLPFKPGRKFPSNKDRYLLRSIVNFKHHADVSIVVVFPQRVFFTLQALIRQHTEELAHSITVEQGKTLADARGDVFRGLEVVETACNMGTLIMGETLGNLSRGLDSYSFRQPLGVTAGICPFNVREYCLMSFALHVLRINVCTCLHFLP